MPTAHWDASKPTAGSNASKVWYIFSSELSAPLSFFCWYCLCVLLIEKLLSLLHLGCAGIVNFLLGFQISSLTTERI